MEEKQKIQVIFEFDRSAYDAYLFLMGQKKMKKRKIYGMRWLRNRLLLMPVCLMTMRIP